MEGIIIQRIKVIIDKYYNGNVSLFAKAINLKQNTLNDYIQGNRKPSLALVYNTLDISNSISAEWLMRGKGDMELPQGVIEKAINKFASIIPDCGNTDIFEGLYDEALEEIKRLKVENARLKQQLETKLVASNGGSSSSNIV